MVIIMKYIINLTLTFEPDNQVLMLVNNAQLTIKLSNPATRLLSELIKNNNIVVTRETLIKHVWEEYGFSPSNATLSNHISELRKAFEALGASKNILITVPRIGFKLQAEIHPESNPPKEPRPIEQAELSAPDNEPMQVENNVVETFFVNSQEPLRRMKTSVLFLLLVLFITAAAVAWMMLQKHDQIVLIGIQDKCHIYGLDEGKSVPAQSGRALAMLAEEGIDCTQSDRDIYYMESRPDNHRLKAYLMAVCTKDSETHYKNCNNFKRVE